MDSDGRLKLAGEFDDQSGKLHVISVINGSLVRHLGGPAPKPLQFDIYATVDSISRDVETLGRCDPTDVESCRAKIRSGVVGLRSLVLPDPPDHSILETDLQLPLFDPNQKAPLVYRADGDPPKIATACGDQEFGIYCPLERLREQALNVARRLSVEGIRVEMIHPTSSLLDAMETFRILVYYGHTRTDNRGRPVGLAVGNDRTLEFRRIAEHYGVHRDGQGRWPRRIETQGRAAPELFVLASCHTTDTDVNGLSIPGLMKIIGVQRFMGCFGELQALEDHVDELGEDLNRILFPFLKHYVTEDPTQCPQYFHDALRRHVPHAKRLWPGQLWLYDSPGVVIGQQRRVPAADEQRGVRRLAPRPTTLNRLVSARGPRPPFPFARRRTIVARDVFASLIASQFFFLFVVLPRIGPPRSAPALSIASDAEVAAKYARRQTAAERRFREATHGSVRQVEAASSLSYFVHSPLKGDAVECLLASVAGPSAQYAPVQASIEALARFAAMPTVLERARSEASLDVKTRLVLTAVVLSHLQKNAVPTKLALVVTPDLYVPLIDATRSWKGDINVLGAATVRLRDGALKAALLAGLTLQNWNTNDAKVRADLESILHDPNADQGTQSIARYCLQQWFVPSQVHAKMITIYPTMGRQLSPYEICSVEVTVNEFADFAATVDDLGWRRPKDAIASYPVTDISWRDCVRFCNWKSEKNGLQPCYQRDKATGQWTCDPTKPGYRLPTDDEWEYACQADLETPYFCGETPRPEFVARKRLARVASRLPNHLGLFDMHGNAAEWCENWFDASHRERTIRGGDYDDPDKSLESRFRDGHEPDIPMPNVGLRLARSPEPAHLSPDD